MAGLLRALIGAFPTFDPSCAPAQSTMLCRRKIEMTPGAQSRNDTPPAADAERNTASLPHAGLGWRGQGPKPALAGAHSAALEAVARAQHHRAAVRTGRTIGCRQSRL
jgi:hypothetical protein